MLWNDHSKLAGSHAFLSASNYHWLNYDEAKLKQSFLNHAAVKRGTELHEYAAMAIKLKRRQPKTKDTLNMYINDAIGFDMNPEQVLFFSEYAYGTADAISFKDDFLRIHDLKTGKGLTKMEQLYIYAALFCLEYNIKPGQIEIETRIYQSNDVRIDNPDATTIAPIMSKIKSFDKIIRKMEQEI